jgi:hypothetical protein
MPALLDIAPVVDDEVTNPFTAPPNLTEPESRGARASRINWARLKLGADG